MAGTQPINYNPLNNYHEGPESLVEMFVEKAGLVHQELPITQLDVNGVRFYISSLPVDHNCSKGAGYRSDVVSAEDLLGFAAQQNATIVNLYGSTENTNYLKRIDKNPLLIRPHNSVGGPDIEITKDHSDNFASGIVSTYSAQPPASATAEPITILHDLDWVDYSVIPIPNLIDIINQIDSQHNNTAIPSIPIIHCLAGAGRSGTFAAAYILSKNVEHVRSLTGDEATAYLFDVVLQLKTQRSALLVEVAPQVDFLTRYMDYLRTGVMPAAPVDSVGRTASDADDPASAA